TVGGSAKNPTVLGNIRIEDGAASLRGLPVAARALNGSISFSQDALVIDSQSGKLNNGEARVSGGIEMERLAPMKIDMSAHGLDVRVGRGAGVEKNLARTDLEGDLKITGTSRAIGLLGSVNTVHGTAAFRGNDFQIEQGDLTFTDRQRIRPSFDFQLSSQVKE